MRTKRGENRNRVRKSRKAFTLFLAVAIMIGTMICLSGFTGADGGKTAVPSVSPSRYYEVIRVSANDTLWDIASRCTTGHSASCIRATVQEIMQVNSLSGTRIYVGQQIAVPCYVQNAA